MKDLIKSILIKLPIVGSIVVYFYYKIWLFDLCRFFNFPFELSINNSRIKLYAKGQISKFIFMKKFEQTELELFSKLIKPGMTVVDAGANIGLYSLLASQLIGESGQVFSFEPSRETYSRLEKNIALNQVSNVKAFNLGLGDNNNQELVLRQDIGYEDAERYIVPQDVTIDNDLENVSEIYKSESVKVVTLDSCLKNCGINTIDFLKIDTEGFEYYILNGAKEYLKNPNLILLFECTELGTQRANTSQKQVFDLLSEFGFELYYWSEEVANWCNDEEGCYRAGDLWATKSIDHLKGVLK
jgi:FkbM family methyltransferase